MTTATHIGNSESSRFGVPIESAIERRERFANRFDFDFGRERVFPELVSALLAQIPEGSKIVEVGAATGLLTGPLMERAGHITALEPSEGMLRRLLTKDVANSPYLRVVKGLAEDLRHDELFDFAIVTFTPRRGVGLLRLLQELAVRVSDQVVMLLDDDASMDWAYLARAAVAQGFEVDIKFVAERGKDPETRKRAVLLLASPAEFNPVAHTGEVWDFDARTVTVPYPAPRGSATRLVRYFLSGGDRAVMIRTDKRGVERLYGNLRTAVHRLARDEVTVRRTDDGVQMVRLPRSID